MTTLGRKLVVAYSLNQPPLSKTRIRSACSAVESRRAILTALRPSDSRQSAFVSVRLASRSDAFSDCSELEDYVSSFNHCG